MPRTHRTTDCFLAPENKPSFRTFALFLLIAVGCSQCILAEQKVQKRQTPSAVLDGTAKLLEPYNPELKLRLVFALRSPHPEQEEQYLRQLQDRSSPQFHKYLTQEEWNARFAPSAADELAVVTWAESNGLTVTKRYPNRLLVDVEGKVGNIEKALDVTINRYQLGEKAFFSNDRDPLIPSQLARIIRAVLGLNNLEVFRHLSHNSLEPPHPDYSPGPAHIFVGRQAAHGNRDLLKTAVKNHKLRMGPQITGGAYDPTDIYNSNAYDYDALNNLGHCCNPLGNPDNSPPEASIAVAIWNDFSFDDIAGFHDQYPYLAYNVTKYFVDGTPPCCDGEATMDTEWTTATANSFGAISDTAEIFVYEGADNQFSTLLDVVNNALNDGNARVLSMSWGAAEQGFGSDTMDAFHAVFDQMIGEGWTLVASSGDNGATTACVDLVAVNYPASDPDVTAAGGTTLVLNADGTYYGQVGWSGGPDGCATNDGGSGGGCSIYYGTPDYQGNTQCASYRALPDIALNADWYYTPQNIYLDGQLQGNGGTSIVAPEISGFFAQVNAYLLALGDICGSNGTDSCAPLGEANYGLYEQGLNQDTPHYPFYDITEGCNNNDITEEYGLGYYCATQGLDQVTGWGSANMLQLAWTFNTYFAFDNGAPTASFSGPTINRWYNGDQTISWTITDTSGNGAPPNGLAGYTAQWDSDPGDVYTEPTPGSGNSFYSGPLTPNANQGFMDLASASSQGWHTVNMRVWDNSGLVSADLTYGPVGYDTMPPVTTVALSGTQGANLYGTPVQVTLTATDNASGVAATYYAVDGGTWLTYSAPFIVSTAGDHTVAFYSIDVAGNQETTNYVYFTIHLGYNTLTVTPIGSGTVTSGDGNINCPGTCAWAYPSNTPVTLNAYPAQGSSFVGWTGACSGTGSCNLTMTQSFSVAAIFAGSGAQQLVTITPCRLVDTRQSSPIQGGTVETFDLPHLAQTKGCADLSSAAVYSLNVTLVPQNHHPVGYLTIWPTGEDQPVVSTMNSLDGRIKANAAIVPAGTNLSVNVYVTNTLDVVLDVDGYFAAPTVSTLSFYPLPPCRVADTRKSNFPQGLGTPHLSQRVQRDFPVLNSPCIPSQVTPAAYSFNFTAIPYPNLGDQLGYLEIWPTGQRPQNPVSTLNNLTGTYVANAAIVPAGTNGNITAYADSDTDLAIDINGYFASPGTNGLSLYPVTPCRVIDTRKIGAGQPFNGVLNPPVDVVDSVCAPPSTLQAYVFNATVVPSGYLGYLSLWPDGEVQPVVSTLNAADGYITSDMAIVPTNNGYIDAYAAGLTQLVLDMFSYFAP